MIESDSQISIPADQAWYWTPEWQAGEQAADAQLAQGGGTIFRTDEEFDGWLDNN